MEADNIIVRKYDVKDREAVRKISCDTAFLENSSAFVDDLEVLADALTMYFTDFEPGSCFVACDNGRVVGYLTGAKNIRQMNRVFNAKILPQILSKCFERGLFFRKKTSKFFLNSLISFLRGEFFAPDFSRQYPAILHINIDKNYRGRRVGEKLIASFIRFLKENNIKGVHLSTFSEGAKEFFIKQGFKILFSSKRSYMHYYLGRYVLCYVLAKNL